MLECVYVMKKLGKKWLLVGLLVIVVIGVIAFILLNRIDPKKYYLDSFSNMKNYLIKNTDAYSKDFTGDFDLKMKTTSTDSYKKLFADTEVSGNYGYSSLNKQILLNLDSKYQNAELISANVFLANNKIYYKSTGLLNNYYFSEMDKYDDLFNNANADNNKNIINGIMDGINSSLKDSYFDVTKENNEKVVELKISGDNYKQFITDLFNNLKNNADFMKSYASLSGMTNSEITSDFDNTLTEITNDNELNIKTYLLNNKIDKITLALKQDINEINLEYNKNTNLITYNISSNDLKADGNLTITSTDTGSSLDLVVNYDGMTYTLTTNVKYNQTFTAPIISGAQDINDITEDDSETLLSGLYNNQTLLKFVQALYNLESEIS